MRHSEIPAVVLALEGGHARLETMQYSACGGCRSGDGCGKIGETKRVFVVPNLIEARPGDKVLVAVADGMLLRSAIWAYFVPVALVLAGAAMGAGVDDDGVAAAFGAAVGLVIGFVLFGAYGRRAVRSREPLLSMRLQGRTFHFQEEIRK